MTEAEMLRLLRAYVCKDGGNGASAVLVPHVRSAAGFDSKRTIDAVGIGLWPSRGLLIDGYEIKVSRSDWLRELKNPAKAEEFGTKLDRLWLVVSDPEIVLEGELPPKWGLLVKSGKGLRQKVAAERLHAGDDLPPGFGRSFLAPLVRAADSVPADVKKALDEAKAEIQREANEKARESYERSAEGVRRRLDEAEAAIAAFQRASGIHIGYRGDEAKRVGEIVKAITGNDDSLEWTRRGAAQQARNMRKLADELEEFAAEPVQLLDLLVNPAGEEEGK